MTAGPKAQEAGAYCTEPCDNCPFKGPKVAISGDITSPVVVIGEGPGVQEVRQGAPFVGPTGQILWKHLPEIDREEILVMNAMRCLPQRKKKDPKNMVQGVRSCMPYIEEVLSMHPRKYILALGNSAVWAATTNFGHKITQIRGTKLSCGHTDAIVVPAVHPAAIMRGTGNYRQFVRDLDLFQNLVRTGKFPKAYQEPDYEVIDVPEQRKGLLGCDLETTGFYASKNRVLCAGIAHQATEVDVLSHSCDFASPEVRRQFEIPPEEATYIWHNGKFDCGFLWALGINARVDEDTMLLSYCLDETGGVHGLEDVMGDYLGAPNYKNMLERHLPKKGASYEHIPKEVLWEYQAIDAAGTLQAFEVVREKVRKDPDLEKLYTQVLLPAQEMLIHVEQHGMLVDPKALEEADRNIAAKVEEATESLQELAGRAINPGSPQQMATLIFDEIGLKPPRGGRSTAADVLDKLPNHPVVEALQQHRKWSKLYNTYIKGIWRHLEDSPDNRIHTTFLLHGTQTGRLSSRDPNLQNIPRGPLIRSIFRAPDGKVIVEIDLNQAELRSLAALSSDDELCAIYESTDRSLHHEVSVDMFGENYTSEQKMRAKAVNFGIVYGRTAPSLAYEFNISVREAQKYIDTWLNRFPKARDFIQMCRKAPLRHQTLTTCFGRKKRARIVSRENLHFLQNEAANFPHQSIASDINLLGAVRTAPKIRKMGADIIVLVHDSIIFECPEDPATLNKVIRQVIADVESIAPEWGITRVPFKAEAKIGTNWGNLEDYTGHEQA